MTATRVTRQEGRERPVMVIGNPSFSLLLLLAGCFINSLNRMMNVERSGNSFRE